MIKIKQEDRLFVNVDLYHAGTTEDGSPYEAEAYTVVLQSERGNRLAHSHTWFTASRSDSPDGFSYFFDDRNKMMRQAEELVESIQKKGELNEQYWTEIEPSYGSDAYCAKYGF